MLIPLGATYSSPIRIVRILVMLPDAVARAYVRSAGTELIKSTSDDSNRVQCWRGGRSARNGVRTLFKACRQCSKHDTLLMLCMLLRVLIQYACTAWFVLARKRSSSLTNAASASAE